jgi:hypothetical protein
MSISAVGHNQAAGRAAIWAASSLTAAGQPLQPSHAAPLGRDGVSGAPNASVKQKSGVGQSDPESVPGGPHDQRGAHRPG